MTLVVSEHGGADTNPRMLDVGVVAGGLLQPLMTGISDSQMHPRGRERESFEFD